MGTARRRGRRVAFLLQRLHPAVNHSPFIMRRIPHLTALAVCLALAVSMRAATPFAQAESDLRADPDAAYGTLPNGLRYVVRPNHEPKGRVSMRLLVLAGSFDETEAQRGLAHYLEHMAFNGSTHYAPGTLVEKLQRMGMGFGADTNAATSFDHTIYQLELPDTAPATIAEGLQIFEDYGGGLLLQQAMVDKERGIILSEKRTRDSVGYRTMVAQFEFIDAGTRVPDRIPIGLSEVIEKSNRDPFVEFYNAWYRPENMVVIVVGDIDGPSIVRQIVDGFSRLAPRAPAPAPADLGRVSDFKGVKTLYHGEPESPDTSIVIATNAPYAHEADTGANRIKYLPRAVAVDMLNRRLDILSKKENAPFTHAETNVEDAFNLFREATLELACKPDQWTQAMKVVDQELRRALEFGFRPDELKEAVADFRNNVEQAVKTAPTRPSRDLAGDIAQSIVDRDVYTSAADDLALYGPALDKVTAAECVAALREAWSGPGRYVYVAGNLRLAGDANQVVLEAYNRAESGNVRPTDDKAAIVWAYGDFGAPGAVASRTHIDDLDITEVTFANGVRLDLKKTDFEANTIHVAVRIGSGQLTEPASEPALAALARISMTAGGLGKHSEDDLERVFSGKSVGITFAPSMDAFNLSGSTNKEDLALEFQLLAASIEDPGYRPEALRVARKRIEEAYNSYEHTDRGAFTLQVPKLLSGGDPRFGLPGRDEAMARNFEELKAWLGPQLASGALEVTVVGDFDTDTVISDAAKTVGTLPKRDPKPALDDLRKVAFPSTPFNKDFGYDTKIPKAVVASYWPTPDGMDVRRARRLTLLASVLSDRIRVRVREQLGSTYAPNVASTASDIFPGYGYISANVVVDPAKAQEIEAAVTSVSADLSANGATQDEIDRAKNPALTAIRETERKNTYWLVVLGRAQERPETLDWARSRRADFESISKADIDALARAYLAPATESHVIVHPNIEDTSGPMILRPRPTPTPTPPPDGA
jgi:zinc protease